MDYECYAQGSQVNHFQGEKGGSVTHAYMNISTCMVQMHQNVHIYAKYTSAGKLWVGKGSLNINDLMHATFAKHHLPVFLHTQERNCRMCRNYQKFFFS